jgi:aryl-alcohol dehydrogenase-like predicted oxidoreductase
MGGRVSDQDGNTHEIFQGVELGVGTWAWGDRMFWGYRQGYGLEDVKAAFQTSLEGGLVFFDTAEVYGMGQSEKLLGSFLKTTDQPARVATKFFPFPWRLTGNALKRALKASLSRLGLPRVDLYQVHWPYPPVRIETWMEAMAEVCQAGLAKAVGVSNYSPDQTRRAFESLQHEGIRLASNQVEYHLLNRKIETNGLLQQCRDMGVKIIAYSPLAQGILTGKYTPQNLPRGFRGQRYNRSYLERVVPLVSLLKKIGADHEGKNAGQVALNWCICKGTLPIPGAKTLQQAEQNCGAAGWRLTENEIFLLDETSSRVLKD